MTGAIVPPPSWGPEGGTEAEEEEEGDYFRGTSQHQEQEQEVEGDDQSHEEDAEARAHSLTRALEAQVSDGEPRREQRRGRREYSR